MSTPSDAKDARQHAEALEHLRAHGFSDDAIAFVDTQLVDDLVAQKMYARLTMVADELGKADLAHTISSALFLRALDLSDAKAAAELPFELDQTTSESIDGAQSSPAMQEHCTSDATRQAAAVLNTVRQICRQKTSYAWADELMREGPINTYVQVALSVVDEELARVSLALNDELRLLPKLDELQDRDTGESLQAVNAASLVVFWTEDGAQGARQVHCGMSERYGAGWAQVVSFARREGFPIHQDFQGELLGEARIDERLAAIEQGQPI
jgi:hypothetical protein